MNQFNLGNFLNKFVGYSPQGQNRGGMPPNGATNGGVAPDANFMPPQNPLNPGMIQKGLLPQQMLGSQNLSMLNNLRMNSLANVEKSLYLKDLMNLPKEMKEILVLIQNNAVQVAKTNDLKTLLSTNINLANLAELMQKSGKEAMNKLVLTMAEASKQGVNDLSQIKDAMKLINASVSVAGQDNQSQVLKNFMLLYLPWLPLQEGVDFELEIESSEGENGDSETILTIMISTKNYGNIKILLILKGVNSFDIFVNCVENFPKEELLKRINEESKLHSLHSEMTFEQKERSDESDKSRQAKISMSNLTEVNPFLLLMANALIRHTIDLDNQAG